MTCGRQPDICWNWCSRCRRNPCRRNPCRRGTTMRQSHGSGEYTPSQFAVLGQNVILEPGVLVFHPENIEIGDEVYVGHQTILKGYHRNKMVLTAGSWIGQ